MCLGSSGLTGSATLQHEQLSQLLRLHASAIGHSFPLFYHVKAQGPAFLQTGQNALQLARPSGVAPCRPPTFLMVVWGTPVMRKSGNVALMVRARTTQPILLVNELRRTRF